MASRVREGETKVDCSEAAEEVRTVSDIRIAKGPRTGSDRAKKTFSWMAGLPSPMPSSPSPAKVIEPMVTTM